MGSLPASRDDTDPFGARPGPFGDDPRAPADDDDLLVGLNPVQREAVTHTDGPLLVIAGAGSGKTRVLTHRIAHLIRNEGVSPFEILAITFTNKAAEEMRNRVGALVGPVADKMWVSTFHSACVRILRRDGKALGFPSSFTIYDQADAVRLTGYVLRDLNLDAKRFPPRTVHATISAAKNDGVGVDAYSERARVIYERKIADVYREYQARLQRAGAMDFDDLLSVTVELFRTHPTVLDHYQRRFRYVLVDEYQDTNAVQNELVLLLAAKHQNICVVGDSDQCLPGDTLVSTPGGAKRIDEVRVGDQVLATGWEGRALPATVRTVRPGHYTGRAHRIHAGDHLITGTPLHLVPTRPVLAPGGHVVYLMQRTDRGFRVGRTMTVRPNSQGKVADGPSVRLGQEHGDKLWYLKVCDTLEEAAYWESWFAAEYGLPTACFHGVGRKLAMGEDALERLYLELDTASRAKRLMDDLDLSIDHPHLRAAGRGPAPEPQPHDVLRPSGGDDRPSPGAVVVQSSRGGRAHRAGRVLGAGRQGSEPAVRDRSQRLPRRARAGRGGGERRRPRASPAGQHRGPDV